MPHLFKSGIVFSVRFLGLLFVCLILNGTSYGESTLIKGPEKELTVFIYLPSNYEIGGFSFKSSTEIAAQATGLSYRVLNVPYARLIPLAHEFKGCAVLPENLIKGQSPLIWAGPLVDGKLALFQRDGVNLKGARLQDIGDARVGAVLGSSAETELRQAGLSPLTFASNIQILGQLYEGRLDYWLAETASVRAAAHDLRLPVPKIAFAFKTVTFGFACDAGMKPDILNKVKTAAQDFYKDHSDRFRSVMSDPY
jgi:ABC-type amino acid transport substrate-binding protein